MKTTILLKGLLLSFLAFVAIGLHADNFKLVNSTDSTIQFKFAERSRTAPISKLGRGASWGATGDGPTQLSIAGDTRMSPWNTIDADKIHRDIDQARREDRSKEGDTALWMIVPTTFGYDVQLDWESRTTTTPDEF